WTAFFLDSGLAPLALVQAVWPEGKKGKGDGPPPQDVEVQVYQHVEKLGMVVEVLTAQSPAALDRYLTGKPLGVRAADVAALKPYCEEGYTLVCGWAAGPAAEAQARAVRIEFPSDHVFYPLRPTRVYESDVPTAIFVRGWVRPGAGMALPGLRCRHLRGHVTD